MAEKDTETTENASSFDRAQFLTSIKAEQTKKRKEALKQKVASKLAEHDELVKGANLKMKEIEEEINKFEQGL